VPVIIHADNIESPLARFIDVAKIIASDKNDFMPLSSVDRGLRRLYVACTSSLHLNEAKRLLLPRDKVNFSIATRGAEVARHHHIAQFAQIEIRIIFAGAPSCQVAGNVLRRKQSAGNPVQSMDNGLCDEGGDHTATGNHFCATSSSYVVSGETEVTTLTLRGLDMAAACSMELL
jgi:hypothetical protein